jgi:hypothetical protein
MANTDEQSDNYKKHPDQLLSAEAHLISKRRHQALHKQLNRDNLIQQLDALSLDYFVKSRLINLVTAYRAAPTPERLLQFDKALKGLTGKLKDEEKHQLDKLFVRLLPDSRDLNLTNGLALSGGGIRSAAFNLGVLQALKKKRVFEQIDYLSTVSGGGYIGSSLTYFMHQKTPGHFPFDDKTPGPQHVAWIRRHASYLTPGDGLNMWALGAAALRGMLINQFFLIPLWLGIFWVLTLGVSASSPLSWQHMTTTAFQTSAVVVVLLFAAMMLQSQLRRFLNTETWNRASKHIENWPARLIFWVIFLSATLLTSSQNLLLQWSEHSWLFKATPGLVLLLVFFASRTHRLTQRKQLFIESLEIATWALVFWLLYVLAPLLTQQFEALQPAIFPPAFLAFCLVGFSLLAKLAVNYLFFTVLSSGQTRLEYSGHRYFTVQYGDLLLSGIGFCLVGMLPLAHYFLFELALLKTWTHVVISGITLSGILSTLLGWLKRDRDNELSGLVPFLLRLGIVLLVIAATLLSYHWAVGVHTRSGNINLALVVTWVVVFLIFAAVSDINAVSMHSYYRNRLLEAFMRDQEDVQRGASGTDASDNLQLNKIDVSQSGAPYHLINANLVTVGSSDNTLRLRGGANFILSPAYIGSAPTGWASTNGDFFRGLSLATAMAVSGAAVDPNTGVSRSWPLRLIMTWFNFRLGYWCHNPNPEWCKPGFKSRFIDASWLKLIIEEMLGNPHERWSFIRLSDGGHFENLGVYELLRRRCRLIIVSDAGADPDFNFSDLSRAIGRARVDFGVEIEDLETPSTHPARLETCQENTQESNCLPLRMASSPYACGRIKYSDGERGRLIYIKSTLFKGLSEDVLGYARQHPTFPDESTSDQFFSEEQFEAYRELGYRSMARVLADLHLTWSGP